MPTIDELPPAVSVSDTDEVAVSQASILRKATRAQLLSGVEAALALPQGCLLGRASAGLGSPEQIVIGSNLVVNDGVINAPAQFAISLLPGGVAPTPNDRVAVNQGGADAGISYAAFMSGVTGLAGIAGSNLVVAPTGAPQSRRLADLVADAVSIESFGAVGDGVTDDTGAFNAAIAAGRPIRLDSRTYVVDGPLLVSGPAYWLGVPNGTVLRRTQVLAQQAWIEMNGSQVFTRGITFDQGGLVAAESPVVQVDSLCQDTRFEYCNFLNARGSGSSSGIRLMTGAGSRHTLVGCHFLNNDAHGVDICGSGTVMISYCCSELNVGSGINVCAETAIRVSDCSCINNDIGISIGAWQVAAVTAASSTLCLVERNVYSNNTAWGIAVNGYGVSIKSNDVSQNGFGGIVARLGASQCVGNRVSNGSVAIDGRTSWGTEFSTNHVSNATTGILLGGCTNVLVTQNFLLMNQWGVDVSAIEPSLSYSLTGQISITGNWIGFTLAQGNGIFVHDGVTGISIVSNDFSGWGSATVGQALWLHTDEAVVSGNRWNNQAVFQIDGGEVAGSSALVVPDISDRVLILSANNPVESLLTTHQVDTLGQISFIRVTAAGSGYSSADAMISGSGRGAVADIVLNGGQILAIIVVNPGSGYGQIGADSTVTITGNGTGAEAKAYVGLPVLTGRCLRLTCNCNLQLATEGSSPAQQNWTNFPATIPAFAAVEMEGVFGAWNAVSFPSKDYLCPTGDGGAIVQSFDDGDVTLRPGIGGTLHIGGYAEPSGVSFNVGRGSPNGVVVAVPGSDFRNLDGGVGNTAWVKQIGTDANGWIAVA